MLGLDQRAVEIEKYGFDAVKDVVSRYYYSCVCV